MPDSWCRFSQALASTIYASPAAFGANVPATQNQRISGVGGMLEEIAHSRPVGDPWLQILTCFGR